jgi:hypothetical protein
MLPIHNGLKQNDLLPLVFRFPLQYVTWNNKENQTGLKLNGKYQPLVFGNIVNLLDANIPAIKENINRIDIGIGLSYIKNNVLS